MRICAGRCAVDGEHARAHTLPTTRTDMYTHLHARTLSHPPTRTCGHTLTHARARARTHTHTLTHTHPHTPDSGGSSVCAAANIEPSCPSCACVVEVGAGWVLCVWREGWVGWVKRAPLLCVCATFPQPSSYCSRTTGTRRHLLEATGLCSPERPTCSCRVGWGGSRVKPWCQKQRW